MPNLSLMVLEGELVGQFSEEKGIDLTTDHSHSTTMRSINYIGLQEILIHSPLRDRSRVHMHGVEPCKIVQQHSGRTTTSQI